MPWPCLRSSTHSPGREDTKASPGEKQGARPSPPSLSTLTPLYPLPASWPEGMQWGAGWGRLSQVLAEPSRQVGVWGHSWQQVSQLASSSPGARMGYSHCYVLLILMNSFLDWKVIFKEEADLTSNLRASASYLWLGKEPKLWALESSCVEWEKII